MYKYSHKLGRDGKKKDRKGEGERMKEREKLRGRRRWPQCNIITDCIPFQFRITSSLFRIVDDHGVLKSEQNTQLQYPHCNLAYSHSDIKLGANIRKLPHHNNHILLFAATEEKQKIILYSFSVISVRLSFPIILTRFGSYVCLCVQLSMNNSPF